MPEFIVPLLRKDALIGKHIEDLFGPQVFSRMLYDEYTLKISERLLQALQKYPDLTILEWIVSEWSDDDVVAFSESYSYETTLQILEKLYVSQADMRTTEFYMYLDLIACAIVMASWARTDSDDVTAITASWIRDFIGVFLSIVDGVYLSVKDGHDAC